jgi:hypothetical protein
MNNGRFAIAQSPTITNKPEQIPNLHQYPTGNLFNPSITKSNYIPYFMKSQETNHVFIPKNKIREEVLNSVNTNKPHPLARYSSPDNYVQGYFDSSFESTENNRLEHRGSVARAILASDRDRFKYPLLDFSDSDEIETKHMEIYDDENEHGVGYGIINDRDYSQKLKDIFSKPDDEVIKKVNHQKYGTISSSEKPLYPEIYPYISRTSPTEGWSNNDKSRLPAGSNFTSNNINAFNNIGSMQNKMTSEAFNISFKNKTPTIHLTVDETKELEKIIYPNGIPNSHGQPQSTQYGNYKDRFRTKTAKVHVDVKKTNINDVIGDKEGFENPIEKEADYMYLEALKIRAIAVCKFLNNHRSYRNWSSNWKLLEKNLRRNGLLFERLDDTDADIAYVINKGDQVKFRIRDEKRYVPLNIYQYVLYHEMAHMSTTELQHTPKFHELLNIISLAGFELGFIDLSRTTKEFYMTNGQPILCRASMKEEIMDGCDWLKKANPNSGLYYDSIKKAVRKF